MKISTLLSTLAISTILAGANAATVQPALAVDSPLTCAFDGQLTISCDVYVDSGHIDDITVNRGRCQPPQVLKAIRFYLDQNVSPIDAGELSAVERAAFDGVRAADVAAALTMVEEKGLVTPDNVALGLGALTLLDPMMAARSAGDIETAVRIALAIFALTDPTWPDGNVAFGDTLKFNINGCPNLLEYSITVDGTEWVWDAKDVAE